MLIFLSSVLEKVIIGDSFDLSLIKLDVAHMLNVQGLGRDQVFTSSLPDGDRGTAQTVAYARQLIAEGLRNPDVRRLAVEFCRVYSAAPHDELGELSAVFNGVLDNFAYRKHTVGMQLLQPVAGILETRAGDCADLNQILLPSLLGSIGYPTRAVTIKADADRSSEFSHVYIEVMTSDGQWVPLDVARRDPAFGKAPEYYWDRKEWPLTPGSGGQLNGYGVGVMTPTRPKVLFARRRAFPRRGLGDDDGGGFDVGSALQESLAAAPSILGGIAQVVKATQTPNVQYVNSAGQILNSAGQVVGVTATATVGASSGTYVVLALAVGAALLLMGRK